MEPKVRLLLHLNDSASQAEGNKTEVGVETTYDADLHGMVSDPEEHLEDNIEVFPHTFVPAGQYHTSACPSSFPEPP